MSGTAPAAVVEPKKNSQDPAAKAKRIKGLLANPDFAEAVSEERTLAKMWKDAYDDIHREYMIMTNKCLAFIDTVWLSGSKRKTIILSSLKKTGNLIK
jgi:hypothetical protein